jgi:hypothetical protein
MKNNPSPFMNSNPTAHFVAARLVDVEAQRFPVSASQFVTLCHFSTVCGAP